MGVLRTRGAVVLVGAALGTGLFPTTSGGASPASADEPSLELRPELTDFDSVVVGEEDDRTIRIFNLGTATVKIGGVEVEGESFSILFDNCSGTDVERNDSCAVTILFQPPGTGTFDGSVSLSDPVELHGDLVGTGVDTSGTTTVPPSTTLPLPTSAPPTTTVPPTTSVPPTTTVPSATTTPATTTSIATTPPTTLPDVGDTFAEQLAQCEADAAQAQVRFTPTLHMVVGEITDVDVTAQIGENQEPTPTGTGPPVSVVPAILHCEVEATLRGQGFEIDPADPQDGSFIDQPAITWTWQVTPTSAGVRTLQFRILPVARGDGIEVPGTPVLFEATITVEAERRSFWQRVDDVLRGIFGHPVVTGFGALAGIVAVFAAGWRWILKRQWPWASKPGTKASNPRARPPRRRPRRP